MIDFVTDGLWEVTCDELEESRRAREWDELMDELMKDPEYLKAAFPDLTEKDFERMQVEG